jgi:hypothetical protein
MIAPPPKWIRISMANVILIGRDVPVKAGARESTVQIDTVLIDGRPGVHRRLFPLRGIRLAASELYGRRTASKHAWIMLWESSRKPQDMIELVPIPTPVSVEECDWMLDELADSLAESHNPNFATVGRYLLSERTRLPLHHDHLGRRFIVTP